MLSCFCLVFLVVWCLVFFSCFSSKIFITYWIPFIKVMFFLWGCIHPLVSCTAEWKLTVISEAAHLKHPEGPSPECTFGKTATSRWLHETKVWQQQTVHSFSQKKKNNQEEVGIALGSKQYDTSVQLTYTFYISYVQSCFGKKVRRNNHWNL